VVFGVGGDTYFDNLGAYAAQNDSLVEELQKLPPDAVVMDVGANIGITTVMASRAVPAGRVFAFEPGPTAFACLSATVAANALGNCAIHNVGLGASAGELPFTETDFLAGSYVGGGAGAGPKVRIRTLDVLAAEAGIQRLDLVKIDVEGFELDVLRGAAEAIARFRPRFVMEFNSYALIANRDQSPRKVLDFVLERFGSFYARRDGATVTVTNDLELRHFLYSNMVTRGCIDDIHFG
jgi:FkbM family methyltransferase